MKTQQFKALFLDIGGVFLSNGWDHHMREKAAQVFHLDYEEMNRRHALTFDTYECGKISLDTYLDRAVFYVPRNFSKEEFKTFMFTQSTEKPYMIEMIRTIKNRFGLKTVVISNEGRELMEDRINRFKMKEFIDFFICSAFVKLRKPDEEIYRLAIDMAQVKPSEAIYIDDREMLVKIGKDLGFESIQHIDYEETYQKLMDLFRERL